MKRSNLSSSLVILAFLILAFGSVNSAGAYTLYQAADKPELKFSGFLQVLYKTMQSDPVYNLDSKGVRTDRDGFNVPRVRLGAGGKLRDDVSFKLEADFKLSNISLMEGTITYSPLKAFSVVGGQFKTPFSREYLIPTSDSDTILPSQSIDKITTKYDVGLLGKVTFLDEIINLQAGIFNGEGQNAIASDEYFLVIGRLFTKPVKGLELGGSTGGERIDPISKTQDNRWYDGYLYLDMADVTVKCEYINKFYKPIPSRTSPSTLGISTWGISGLAGYTLLDGHLQPLVRVEYYEPNNKKDDDKIMRITGGLNYFITKKKDVKLMANYIYEKEETTSIDNNQLLIQAQIKY